MNLTHPKPLFWNRAGMLSGVLFVILAAYKTLQHLTFNTYAYDLGIRASILYNVAFGGRVWDSLHSLHGFSGHFHPASYILAGLYRLWPNALHLCLLQALAVSLGFWILLRLLDTFVADRAKYIPFAALFLINPFLHHVLSFDFHPEIFALPLALGFFYLFENKRTWCALIPAFALLTLKEDMGLLLLALGVYALVRRRWIQGALMSAIGLVWLPLVLLVIIPQFQLEGQTQLIALHYPGLGQTAQEVLTSIIHRPWVLITHTFGQPQKLLTVALLAASVGGLALARWEAALALPLLAAHLLSSGPHQSSLTYQYSAGILPLLFFAGVRALPKIRRPVLYVLCALAVPAVLMQFPNPFKMGIEPARAAKTHALIERIPPKAPVSVTNNLAPHLVNRERLMLYPRVEGACYVLADLEGNIYPARWETRYERFRERTEGYDTLSADDGLLLLRKK